MDIGSLLLGLALLLVIAFVVARPLLEQTGLREAPPSPADRLLGDRERVLTQLRDLDFDHAMSKINEVDYAGQRGQLVAEGVAILKQLDGLGLAPGQPAGAPPAPADEIEAAVAQLRARRAASARTAPAGDAEAEIEASVAERRSSKLPGGDQLFCGQCGAEAVAGDRFCARCGSPLPTPAAGLRQAKVQS